MRDSRYPEICVSGPPRELGRQIGEAARETIRGFCDIALQRVNLTVPVSRESALQVAAECIPLAEAYAPDTFEELRGTAEGAGVPLEDLMLVQVRNQFTGDDAGCTSLSLGAPRCGSRFVAQNWDNDPAWDEFTVVLTRRPVGKPAFTTVAQAGLIAYIGFSDAGIGLCLNTLPAPSRRIGVPHYFTVRGIYESRSLEEAVDAVRAAERAIPANIMMTTPEGPADLEVTLDDVRVLRDADSGIVTHTNHCEHPDLVAINEDFPELIQSHARKRRIGELIGQGNGNELSLDRIQAALRDHQDYPTSICRHANEDPKTGFWQTVFSVIIEPEQRRMYVARGTPCDHPYETYEMATG